MIRRHTTGPVQPVRSLKPVAPVAPHRRGVPARLMLQRAVQFYRGRLRAMARARPDGVDKTV